MDVIGDGSKVRCCKEQYCIGTWNVRSLNQCKLEVVKQEMARVNIDILSTTVGRNPLEEMDNHHGQQESEMQSLDAISKMTE